MKMIQFTLFLLMLTGSSWSMAEQRNVALLASACAACHGTNGHSQGGIPVLAGLDTLYFIEQMKLFRSGERQASVMMQHSAGYSEEEVRLLADYFARQ